jgi:hypothetical protein
MTTPHRLEDDRNEERIQTAMPEPNATSPKSAWLTPQFAWQVGTFLIVQIVAAVIAFQILSADVRSSREEQGRMRTDIQAVLGEIREIRQAIPNREALDERLRNMEKEAARLSGLIDSMSDKAEARWDNVNTRLSRKGL